MDFDNLTNESVETDDGCSLKIRLIGHGPTKLLFIHGWMTSGVTWSPLLDVLDWSSYTAVVPDLRGTGYSDKPDDGYNLIRFSKDIESIIDHLNWSNTILIGHSMGGAIGQLLTQRRPDAVKRLILMAPVPLSGLKVSTEIEDLVGKTHGTRKGAKRMLEVSTNGSLPSAIEERHIDAAMTCSREFWVRSFFEFSNGVQKKNISKIKTRTTIIVGSRDPIINGDTIKDEVNIPCEVEIREIDSQHYIFTEEPIKSSKEMKLLGMINKILPGQFTSTGTKIFIVKYRIITMKYQIKRMNSAVL